VRLVNRGLANRHGGRIRKKALSHQRKECDDFDKLWRRGSTG
jgi:hypothetical protein